MIKRSYIIIALGTLIALILIISLKRRPANDLAYQVFTTERGWGYDILVNGKIRIHQDIIPGSMRNEGYATEAEARTAAALFISQVKVKKRMTGDSSAAKRIHLSGDKDH